MFFDKHFVETEGADSKTFHKDFPGAGGVISNVHYTGEDEVAKYVLAEVGCGVEMVYIRSFWVFWC